MTSNPKTLATSRRRFLKASGLALAIPAMPSLTRPAVAAAEAASPIRLCYLYVPNGVNMEHWRPGGENESLTFNRSTASLEPFRDDIRFVSGLSHKNATGGKDGAGDHARANATFLTGSRALKTAGTDIHLGISADQIVAKKFAAQTRLRSLELSCDGVRRSGNCDSGYACAYQFNLAWADERTPVAPESNP